MIKTYRSCASLGICQGDGRCLDCDPVLRDNRVLHDQPLRPWPPRYPFAPGVIDGLPNADAQSLRHRLETWLVRAAYVLSALVVGGAVAGYITGVRVL